MVNKPLRKISKIKTKIISKIYFVQNTKNLKIQKKITASLEVVVASNQKLMNSHKHFEN